MKQKKTKTQAGAKAVTIDGKNRVSSAAKIQWVEAAERLAPGTVEVRKNLRNESPDHSAQPADKPCEHERGRILHQRRPQGGDEIKNANPK